MNSVIGNCRAWEKLIELKKLKFFYDSLSLVLLHQIHGLGVRGGIAVSV